MEEGCGSTDAAPASRGRDEADDLLAVARVLRGDTDAFRSIVERYRGLVYRLALASLGNREDAEEAVQEIFVRAFRSLRGFRMDRQFVPWLYSIAVNRVRSRSARRQCVDGPLVRDREELVAATAANQPEETVLRAAAADEVRRAVAGLPGPVREAVTLYYLEGMSVDQAASMLGVGRENVKSRLLRGRRKLRELLEPGPGPCRDGRHLDGADEH